MGHPGSIRPREPEFSLTELGTCWAVTLEECEALVGMLTPMRARLRTERAWLAESGTVPQGGKERHSSSLTYQQPSLKREIGEVNANDRTPPTQTLPFHRST